MFAMLLYPAESCRSGSSGVAADGFRQHSGTFACSAELLQSGHCFGSRVFKQPGCNQTVS